MISGVGASTGMRMALEPIEGDLPVTDTITYSKPVVSGSGGFKILSQSSGRIAFDLNDGYSMWVDESRSAFSVANRAGKETVQVWGTAQLALDDTTLGSFAGTTSLVLDNGTKITMETLAAAKMADLFYLDRLTVTQNERAMIVAGLSQLTAGDLTVVQSQNGDSVDADTRDGLVFEQVVLPPVPPVSASRPTATLTPPPTPVTPEPTLLAPVLAPTAPETLPAAPVALEFAAPTPVPVPPMMEPPPPSLPPPATNTLAGWADEYGIAVTPEMLAATRPGGEFGPGSELMSIGEFRALLVRLQCWGSISSLWSQSVYSVNSDLQRQDQSDVARASEIRRAWARHAGDVAAATRAELRGIEMRAFEFNG